MAIGALEDSVDQWALGLASAQRQRLKPKESTTGHEDRAVQRITLCRRQNALNMGRQPFRQGLRESTDQTDGGTPDIFKPFNDTCGSVCCLLSEFDLDHTPRPKLPVR